MPYTVGLLRSAIRELSSLPKDVQLQVAARLDQLERNPLPHGVQQLHGEPKLYRLRVGDYRILYEVDHDTATVTVTTIGNRRDVYRRR